MDKVWRINLPVVLFVLVATTPLYADDIEVYFNHPVNYPAETADLEEKIITLIDSADNSLLIAVYDLDLPSIASAMTAAKARGVDVRFITDEDNVSGDNELALSILNSGNVPWIDDTENGSAGSNIQHNKFIVADGKTVLTGSTNFTQSGIHGDLDEHGNLINEGNDNHIVIIQSEELATVFTTQFAIMWGDGPGGLNDSLFGLGKPDHLIETVYTTNEAIRIDIQFTPQSPTLFTGSTLDNMAQYLESANQRIHLAQFVISAQHLADVMKARHNAGVEIQGIGDSSFFYRYFSEFQDMLGMELPNNNGVPEVDSYTGEQNNPWCHTADVRVANLAGGDKWHHKYFIIDDMVITGSHNASGAAAFGNDENVVVIHDARTAAEFEGHFARAYCEAGYAGNCGGPTYEGGTWEGVAFTGSEVGVVMDIVNNASFSNLDIDAAMNKRAVENILAARPITSMDQLSAIPYVGPAALQDLVDYIPVWVN